MDTMTSFAYQQNPAVNIKKFIVAGASKVSECIGRVSNQDFQDWGEGGGGGCLCKVQFSRINNNNEQFITA